MRTGAKCLAIACALLCAGGVRAAEQVLIDFDAVGFGGYQESQADVTDGQVVADDVAPARGSAGALRFQYDSGLGNGWGQHQGDLSNRPLDLSTYTELRFWAKADAAGAGTSIVLVTDGWASEAASANISLTTTWTEYTINMTEFAGADLASIGHIKVTANGTAHTMWTDEIHAWKPDAAGPPTVSSYSPDAEAAAPDAAAKITVAFDKEVTGVAAGALTVNGSAATSVTSGNNITYVFTGFTPPTSTDHTVGDTVNVVLAAGSIASAGSPADTFAGDSWSFTVYDPKDTEAPYTTPTIDGIIGAGEWPGTMHSDWETDPTQDADFGATWSVAHDAENFYLLIDVRDSLLQTGPNPWDADCQEIYIDWNRDRSSRTQYRIDWSTGAWASSGGTIDEWVVVDNAGGYIVEARFAKPAGTAAIIGFDVSPGDNDDGASRETIYWWNVSPTNGGPWDDPTAYGNVALLDLAPVAQEGVISNIYPPYIDQGSTVILTARDGSGYQWSKDGAVIAGATNRTLVLDPILEGDAGTYSVSFNDGSADVTEGIVITVNPEGSVPVGGLLGLGALVAACGFGGARVLRKKAQR